MVTVESVPAARLAGEHGTAAIGSTGRRLGMLLIFAVVVINQASFRVREPDALSFDWQIALRLAACACCGVYGLAHLRSTFHQLIRFPGALAVLFGTWSLLIVPFAANLPYAATGVLALWCLILFVPAVLEQFDERHLLSTLIGAIVILLVATWFVYLFIPSLGRVPYEAADQEGRSRLAGLMHPNGVGLHAALLVGLLLVARLTEKMSWSVVLPIMLFALATVIATGSRTAVVVSMLPIGVLFIRRQEVAILALFAGCAVLTIVLLWLNAGGAVDDVAAGVARSGDSEEVFHLTGRIELWRFVADRIEESPVVGYGYACSRFALVDGPDWAVGRHTHNLLLEVTLGTGIVGGMLVTAMFGSQFLAWFKDPSPLADVVMAVVFLVGLTGSAIFSVIPDAPTMLFLIALFWRQRDKTWPIIDSIPPA